MTEIILPFFRIRNNFFYETEGVRAPTGYILKKKDLYMIIGKENLNCVCGGGGGGGGVGHLLLVLGLLRVDTLGVEPHIKSTRKGTSPVPHKKSFTKPY
jgi:hypothetical protein